MVLGRLAFRWGVGAVALAAALIALIASKGGTKKITAKNSKSLVETHQHGANPFYCQIGL
jgi:hypothetical protein